MGDGGFGRCGMGLTHGFDIQPRLWGTAFSLCFTLWSVFPGMGFGPGFSLSGREASPPGGVASGSADSSLHAYLRQILCGGAPGLREMRGFEFACVFTLFRAVLHISQGDARIDAYLRYFSHMRLDPCVFTV